MKENLRIILIWVVSLGVSLTTANAQSGTSISGTVLVAANGEPLVGVNILVKGKVIGTITNLDGKFSLTVNDNPPLTLVVSSVGYNAQEVEITESQTADLDIQLSEHGKRAQQRAGRKP